MRLKRKASLRVVEHAALTDVGRQREGNEDSMLEDPPLFVVADGMGGAQAGEVASSLAVDTVGSMRPDDDDTPPERYFTAANAERYRKAASERGIAELGVAEHMHRFTQSLAVWQHPWWRRWARDDVDDYCAFVREETDLRLGIEADYVSGREDRIASFLESYA